MFSPDVAVEAEWNDTGLRLRQANRNLPFRHLKLVVPQTRDCS